MFQKYGWGGVSQGEVWERRSARWWGLIVAAWKTMSGTGNGFQRE